VTHFVLDASAVVVALTEASNRGGRLLSRIAEADDIAVPAHYHAEAANALRGMERGGLLDATSMFGALRDLNDLPVIPHQIAGPLLTRALELRANATAYDALYLALAEQLGCAVVTADAKLVAVPGVQCSVETFTT
jgi:predicted nucleic acid-binding protein